MTQTVKAQQNGTDKRDIPGLGIVDVQAFIAEITEKHPPIRMQLGGRVFECPPPQLWPDDVLANAQADPIAAARGLLGEDYPAWVELGGSAMLLVQIVLKESGVDSLGEFSRS